MGLRGVNLGNWLVLEKWMGASPLSSAKSEDDRGLIDEFEPEVLAAALEEHRSTFITEDDFAWMEREGIDLVRIPVPYYLFGTAHHTACVDHLDNALAWAERHHIRVLIDLHTVPYSQNGFDNGGYMGLCAWAHDQARIDETVDTLEAIALRYQGNPALWGIEPLNEPASAFILEMNLKNYGANYPDRVARSKVIERSTLLAFYDEVYHRLRPIVGPDVKLVFHDQFERESWDHLLPCDHYENIAIDTHMYLVFSEWGFRKYDVPEYVRMVKKFAARIKSAARYHEILVGEWCLGNHSPLIKSLDEDGKRSFYRAHVRTYVLCNEFQYLFRDDLLRDLCLRLKNGKTRLVGRRFYFHHHALLETARQPLFASLQVLGCHIAGDDHLLVVLHE